MRRSAGLVVIALLVTAGCSVLDGEARDCTVAGCESGLSLDLSALVAAVDVGPMDVEACLADVCTTSRVAPGQTFVTVSAPELDDTGHVPIRVVVRTGDGSTLVDAGTDVPLRRVAPNGEECGPVCFVARASVLDDGRLVGT